MSSLQDLVPIISHWIGYGRHFIWLALVACDNQDFKSNASYELLWDKLNDLIWSGLRRCDGWHQQQHREDVTDVNSRNNRCCNNNNNIGSNTSNSNICRREEGLRLDGGLRQHEHQVRPGIQQTGKWTLDLIPGKLATLHWSALIDTSRHWHSCSCHSFFPAISIDTHAYVLCCTDIYPFVYFADCSITTGASFPALGGEYIFYVCSSVFFWLQLVLGSYWPLAHT